MCSDGDEDCYSGSVFFSVKNAQIMSGCQRTYSSLFSSQGVIAQKTVERVLPEELQSVRGAFLVFDSESVKAAKKPLGEDDLHVDGLLMYFSIASTVSKGPIKFSG